MDMQQPFAQYLAVHIARGLLVTVEVTVAGILVMLLVAFTAGVGRLSDHAWVRWLATIFIEVFRGTSIVVQLFWAFFVLPQFGIVLPPLVTGFVILGLNEGAYAAEVVRAAVVNRARGQNEACIALNMGKSLRLRRVLIPQSIPAMLPPFGNVMVDLLKNSALVSTITVAGMTFMAQNVRNFYSRSMIVYLTILIVYFILAQLLALLTKWLERRFDLKRPARSFIKAQKAHQPIDIDAAGATSGVPGR